MAAAVVEYNTVEAVSSLFNTEYAKSLSSVTYTDTIAVQNSPRSVKPMSPPEHQAKTMAVCCGEPGRAATSGEHCCDAWYKEPDGDLDERPLHLQDHYDSHARWPRK